MSAMQSHHDAGCFEHSCESFYALIDAIKALGFDEKTAGRYAAWIGDTPIFDSGGKIVVEDDQGREIDRIALDYFGKPHPKKIKAIPPKTLRCLPPADYYYIRRNWESFARGLVKPIVALGYDETTAARFARLIAKNPCKNESGKVVVVDNGEELAHLDLNLFPGGLLFITGDNVKGEPDPFAE